MSKRISVLSVPIDCVTMDEAVQRILQLTEAAGATFSSNGQCRNGYAGQSGSRVARHIE